MISGFLVDGKPFETEEMIRNATGFKTVEIEAMHRSDYMLEMIDLQNEKRDAIICMIEDYSADILVLPWDKSIPKTKAILENALPVVKVLEAALDVFVDINDSWKEEAVAVLKELSNVMNLFTSAIALKDLGCLSDISVSQILPLIKQALNMLQGPIKGQFEKERPKYEAPSSQ